MKDAQYAEIIRRLTRIEASQKQLARSLKIHDMKADGQTEGKVPWARYKEPRKAQIEAVRQRLSALCSRDGDKSKLTNKVLRKVCEALWTQKRDGYPNAHALKCACQRVHVMDFV